MESLRDMVTPDEIEAMAETRRVLKRVMQGTLTLRQFELPDTTDVYFVGRVAQAAENAENAVFEFMSCLHNYFNTYMSDNQLYAREAESTT